MSVFEDLIDELKNENLLEETVIDPNRADAAARNMPAAVVQTAADANPTPAGLDLPPAEVPANDIEFYRKRAMDEVSSLQMVEHVFSGIEREYTQVSPEPFDDLNAKKALHKFLQVSEDPAAREHAEAEFALRHETEAWNFALHARDEHIPVASIRRFCEESKPVLSSQALIALARFYRNSPYSEEVRAKFDYVMTRLFSRESGEETRAMLFGHSEMIGHINTLYANWSSIALYTQQDDQIEVSLTVTRFQEFTVEVENASSFDELLESDYFGRVRTYKESSAEMFYVPEVVASSITCNLAIGNRFVALMGLERSKRSVAKIEARYGEAYDEVVSEAAGKTLVLANVLAMELEHAEPVPEQEHQVLSFGAPTAAVPHAKPAKDHASGRNFFGINKWLMMFCVVCLLASGSVYIWAEKFAGGSSEGGVIAKPLDIDDPDLKQYVKTPRFTSETLYAVVEPSFDSLTEEQQKDVLGRIQKFASSKSLANVSLLNAKGRTVGFASKSRLELIPQ